MSNILDSRDLQERIEELQGLKDAVDEAQSHVDELENVPEADRTETWESDMDEARKKRITAEDDFGNSDREELDELIALSDEVSEWSSGAQLIPEEDFEDYCQELCKDIGDVPDTFPSYIVIDWEATAQNLKIDYAECEYQGTTYLYRYY